jgi:Ca2+-binding RTX toxin-like protein
MLHAITRWRNGAARFGMLGAAGALLWLAAPATAATTTYPTGAGTFDVDVQGWVASAETCSVSLCTTDAAFDASGGTSGGALATEATITLSLPIGLFDASADWTSPSFAIPADADVDGVELAFDARFTSGGLVALGLTSDVAVTLHDLTDADTTPLVTVALADDATYATQGATLADGAIEAGHSYRLVFSTTMSSSNASLGLLGSASTHIDDVALEVTAQDAAPPPDDGDGGDEDGGAVSGGTGGAGSAGGAGGVIVIAANAPSAITAFGLRCTIVGTPGADRLVGTDGRDVICGRGGNDTIVGKRGNDVLDGGAGRDRLLGGAGRDRLAGRGGVDRLDGGAGRDRLLGGAGRDLLVGRGGVDRLDGGAGRDRLLGGAGRDLLVGRASGDRLVGGPGLDRLFGGGGRDLALITQPPDRMRGVERTR